MTIPPTDLDATDPDAYVPGRPRIAPPTRTEAAHHGLVLVPAASERTAWAEQLMIVLRTEVRGAVRGGVISTGESEQLLARLSLVIDQAIAAG